MLNSNKLIYEIPNGNLIYDLTIKSIRLEIPIVAKYNLFEENKGPYILAGFGLNTFVSWDDKLQVKAYSSGNVISEHSDLDNSNLLPSIGGGLGYNLQINSRPLFIELNYNGAQIIQSKPNSSAVYVTNYEFKIGFIF